MTLVEKILAKKAGKKVVRPDEIVEVSMDRAIPQVSEILDSGADFPGFEPNFTLT